jgi:pimeloyl-ACP methyl ester carboxylesterase
MLVPGNDLCGEFYVPLAEEMASRGISTTLLTLPGYHGVPGLDTPGWGPMVDDLEGALATHLEGGGTLIGHSLGGLLALLLAARRPAQVERLVLLEPAVVPWRWVARLGAKQYQRVVVRGDRSRFLNEPGAFRRVHDLERFPPWAIDLHLEVRQKSDPAVSEGLIESLVPAYPLPVEDVRVPALWLRGAGSGRWPWLAAGLMRRRFRGLTVEVIEGAAHWLANEQDGAVADAVARFAGAS